MTEDEHGTLTISPEECVILAGVCDILVELLADIPDDTPIPEPLMAALCREARRRYDARRGH
jgi:hypothetical protein